MTTVKSVLKDDTKKVPQNINVDLENNTTQEPKHIEEEEPYMDELEQGGENYFKETYDIESPFIL